MTRNAGQHITVDVGVGNQRKTQTLMFVLEETLIALTGSYARIDNSMCQRVKSYGNTAAKQTTYGKFVSAGVKSDSLVEFRYPPGTLSPEQLAINVGLTQLVAHVASTMPDDQIDTLLTRTLEIETAAMNNQQAMQAHIIHGLEILASFGWYETGVMHGLPYSPDDAPVIELSDHDRDHCVQIELPGRDAIMARIRRQLTRFYDRAGLGYTTASRDALNAIDGPATAKNQTTNERTA
jgi:hypothetical protein